MEALQLPLLSNVKDTSKAEHKPKKEIMIQEIQGLRYIENYITEDGESQLLAQVDDEIWLKDLKRRVQHYGFKYDYKARKIDMSMHVGELPEWLKILSENLYREGYMIEVADQVIVNEYLPGQGISAHIDCEPCFHKTIASLSLNSGCIMDFMDKNDRTNKKPLWLAPRSLVVLSDNARYNWLHSIPPRKTDEFEGHKHERKRRVSLTFRKVKIEKSLS